MITFRRASVVAVAAGLSAGLIAGCSGSSGSSSNSGSAPATGAVSSGGSSSATTAPVTVSGQALASSIQSAMAKVTSAHLVAKAAAIGVHVQGNLALSSGQTTASDFYFKQGAGQVEVVTVGKTSYAKLPKAQAVAGKSWVKVSPKSTNKFAQSVAGNLQLVSAISSVDDLADVVRSATSVKRVASSSSSAGGNTTYDMVVNPLQAKGHLASLLQLSGAKQLPVRVTLDPENRPVHIAVSLSVAGASVNVVIDISNYNAPVHISAPPASQVVTG